MSARKAEMTHQDVLDTKLIRIHELAEKKKISDLSGALLFGAAAFRFYLKEAKHQLANGNREEMAQACIEAVLLYSSILELEQNTTGLLVPNKAGSYENFPLSRACEEGFSDFRTYLLTYNRGRL